MLTSENKMKPYFKMHIYLFDTLNLINITYLRWDIYMYYILHIAYYILSYIIIITGLWLLGLLRAVSFAEITAFYMKIKCKFITTYEF